MSHSKDAGKFRCAIHKRFVYYTNRVVEKILNGLGMLREYKYISISFGLPTLILRHQDFHISL